MNPLLELVAAWLVGSAVVTLAIARWLKDQAAA